VRKEHVDWLENPDYRDLNVKSRPDQRSKMTEVVLVDEKSGADSRRIWASLDDDGNLVISGQDIGPKVERFFGTDEYEFVYTVPRAFLESVFLMLGIERFENPLDAIKQFGGNDYGRLADVLEKAKETTPIKFWSWY
jgi:hypothetical protein